MRTWPTRAVEAMTSGSSAGSMPSQSSTRADHAPSTTSNSRVPDASLGSVAMPPPMAARSQSLGCRMWTALAMTSGSCRSSQAIEVAANPVTAGDPSRLSSAGDRASAISRASMVARASAQRIAGRSGLRSLSVTTTPCIWPEKATAVGRWDTPMVTLAATSLAACSHSRGSPSAHPGRGERTR
jgi:hypothetical protein